MESDGPLGWPDDGEEFSGVDDVDTTDLTQPEPIPDASNGPDTPSADDSGSSDHPEESDAVGDANESLELDDLADPGDQTIDATEGDPVDEVTDTVTDPVLGSDPDADPLADDASWTAHDPFPPMLHLEHPPEPVDGYPWTDPLVLGEVSAQDPVDLSGQPPVEDLFAYDGQHVPVNGNPWEALQRSEDPATSSLARFWSATA